MRRKAGEKVEMAKLGKGGKKVKEKVSKGPRRDFTEIARCEPKTKKTTKSRTRLEMACLFLQR